MPEDFAMIAATLLLIDGGDTLPGPAFDWAFQQGFARSVHRTTEQPVERTHPQAKGVLTNAGRDVLWPTRRH